MADFPTEQPASAIFPSSRFNAVRDWLRNNNSIPSGTAANRPVIDGSSSTEDQKAGRPYYATDTKTLSMWDGSAWQVLKVFDGATWATMAVPASTGAAAFRAIAATSVASAVVVGQANVASIGRQLMLAKLAPAGYQGVIVQALVGGTLAVEGRVPWGFNMMPAGFTDTGGKVTMELRVTDAVNIELQSRPGHSGLTSAAGWYLALSLRAIWPSTAGEVRIKGWPA